MFYNTAANTFIQNVHFSFTGEVSSPYSSILLSYKILLIKMCKEFTISISERLKWKDNQILTLKTPDSALDSEYKECHNRGVSWEADNNDTD